MRYLASPRAARVQRSLAFLVLGAIAACSPPPAYDVVIRGGTVYDGSGLPATRGDVAIAGDSIVAVGTVAGKGIVEVDATGMAVAPGFINMLSWATESLIEDGRSLDLGTPPRVLGEQRIEVGGDQDSGARPSMVERTRPESVPHELESTLRRGPENQGEVALEARRG